MGNGRSLPRSNLRGFQKKDSRKNRASRQRACHERLDLLPDQLQWKFSVLSAEGRLLVSTFLDHLIASFLRIPSIYYFLLWAHTVGVNSAIRLFPGILPHGKQKKHLLVTHLSHRTCYNLTINNTPTTNSKRTTRNINIGSFTSLRCLTTMDSPGSYRMDQSDRETEQWHEFKRNRIPLLEPKAVSQHLKNNSPAAPDTPSITIGDTRPTHVMISPSQTPSFLQSSWDTILFATAHKFETMKRRLRLYLVAWSASK